jgi:hypothetical protein
MMLRKERGEGDNNYDNGNHRGEYGGEQGKKYKGNIAPANLFGAASESVAAVATARTLKVSSTSSSVTTSSDKWSSSDKLNGAGEKSKKSRGFKQPLWIPWRSPTSESNEGNGEGFSLCRMMSMMMMQSCMESEQRERQYRNESEQRECEYQLCWEDMAIARKDACVQRQMMNMMFLAMMNRNRGDNSNPPASPSNT